MAYRMANKNKTINKKNKFNFLDVIGLLAIIVIVISFLTLGMRMTGYATSSGIVNVTVNTQVAINFTSNFINFSSGSVTAGKTFAVLESNGSAIDGSWVYSATNFTIVNNGNLNASLQLKSGKTAATLLNGTSPAYKYAVINAKANSCGGPLNTIGTWNVVNTTLDGDVICANFTSAQAANTIAGYVQLTIPSDSKTGNLTDTFTATAT